MLFHYPNLSIVTLWNNSFEHKITKLPDSDSGQQVDTYLMLITLISHEQKQLLSLDYPTEDVIFSTNTSPVSENYTAITELVYEFVTLCLQATHTAFVGVGVTNTFVISQRNSLSWISLSYLDCRFFQCILGGTCTCLAQRIHHVCTLAGI